jgi:hypothetical protein
MHGCRRLGLAAGRPPSGALDDQVWGDSPGRAMVGSSSWRPTSTNNCFKTRLYKIRPDGTARTQVTDGSPTAAPAVGTSKTNSA